MEIISRSYKHAILQGLTTIYKKIIIITRLEKYFLIRKSVWLIASPVLYNGLFFFPQLFVNNYKVMAKNIVLMFCSGRTFLQTRVDCLIRVCLEEQKFYHRQMWAQRSVFTRKKALHGRFPRARNWWSWKF